MFVLWIVLIIGAIWLFTDSFVGHRGSRCYGHRSHNKYMDNHSKYMDNHRTHYENKERPEDLARKRFARGEITREEFEEIMATLKRK